MDDSEHPKFFMDYGYLTDGGELTAAAEFQALAKTAVPKNTVPFVALVDQRSGALVATIVQKKGADAYTIAKLSTVL